jgi:Type IV secretion-system coupling protein DNA-binding domain
MFLALTLLTGGCSVFGVILLARFFDAVSWRNSLIAFKLSLPHDLTVKEVAHWLALINGATHAHRLALLPAPPVALEIVGGQRGITHYLLVPKNMREGILSTVRAALPGSRLEAAPEYLANRPRLRMAAEATLTSHSRPMRAELADTASIGLLASLQPLYAHESVTVQWLITGGGIPRIVSSAEARGQQWWLDSHLSTDSEAVKAERAKQQAPLLRAVVRVGVTAGRRQRRYVIFGRVWAALRTLNGSGVGVVRRLWLPPGLVADRIQRLALPVTTWPLILNTAELAGLVGLATSEATLPGLSLGASRQLPPSLSLSTSGAVLGLSNYPGMTNRRLSLTSTDRLRHTWVLGPTGTGKSTLLGNLIIQDMQAGFGQVIIDAKGDLITDVLSRVPASRQDDVIVIDPSETARPVGFNILHSGPTDEQSRERAVDHVLHIFGELYRSSWGPRTADVLRASLLTLISTNAYDGSSFTLCELPSLLTDKQFRTSVTRQRSVDGHLAAFWQWYDGLSDAHRNEVIGPVLNKLRAFVLSAPLRLLLGQSRGIDLRDVFTKRRIVLVPLSKGSLGTETAQLVGSLLVASVWQVTLGRIAVPVQRRRPAWLYADEFQDFVRLPLDLADTLAQARGFGLGLVMAHQHLGQLPEAVKTAVLSTARTQVLFQLDYDDARVMEQRFTPLSAHDLMGLGSYEIAARLCLDGHTSSPVTGVTLPLPASSTDGTALARASRQRYGVDRSDVEAALTARVSASEQTSSIGRMPWKSQP